MKNQKDKMDNNEASIRISYSIIAHLLSKGHTVNIKKRYAGN